jgi:hypothetical protein
MRISPGAKAWLAEGKHAGAAHVGQRGRSPGVGNVVIRADQMHMGVDDAGQGRPASHEILLRSCNGQEERDDENYARQHFTIRVLPRSTFLAFELILGNAEATTTTAAAATGLFSKTRSGNRKSVKKVKKTSGSDGPTPKGRGLPADGQLAAPK